MGRRPSRFGSLCAGLALAASLALGPPATAAERTEVRKVLDQADRLMSGGRYSEARAGYERALEADRGSVAAWRGLGWSLWRLGDKQKAYQTWQDLLKVIPNEPTVLLAIAQAQEQDRQWDRALESYSRVLSVSPPNDGAREARARIERYLADVAAQQKDANSAIAGYQKSLRERPDHRGTVKALATLYQDTQRYGEGAEILTRYLAAHPDDDELREKLAVQAGLAGNTSEATKQWATLARKHPDEAKWQLALARLLHKAGRTEEANGLVKEVAQREPQNVEALTFLADDAFYAERQGEAIGWIERLVAVQPEPKRINQLGELHLLAGRAIEDEKGDKAAKQEYLAAAQAFRRSAELDPHDVDARLGTITALRLAGEIDEAVRLGEQLHEQYPSSQRATRELYDAYMQTGRYDRAGEFFEVLQKHEPTSLRLHDDGAFLQYARGDRDGAIATLEELAGGRARPNIPVILYHGITASPSENATWVENFRDQMHALQQAGYQAITVQDVLDFLNGKSSLPAKPVLITFDDARADSFDFADPILKEVGYRAAMFIPAAEITRQIPFYATWDKIRQMNKTGRWEMQCHAFLAHRLIPIDGQGTKGRFNANLKWLEAEGRLENEQEFAKRVDDDYRQCKEVVSQEVPGSRVIAYAYPFDDLGQNTLTNYPKASEVNRSLVSRYYALAFSVEPPGFVTRAASPTFVPRLEVPREYRGADLLRHLRTAEPAIAARLRQADFYAFTGRYGEALGVYDRLEHEDVDRSTLFAAEGKVRGWRGDTAEALNLLEAAAKLRPDDPEIAERYHDISLRFEPTFRAQGGAYGDNRDRTNFRVGPSGRVYLTNRISLSPSYEYLQFGEDKFDASALQPSPSGSPAPSQFQPQPQPTPAAGPAAQSTPVLTASTLRPALAAPGTTTKLDVNGHQVQVQAEYENDYRSGAQLSAGLAQFENRSSSRTFGSSSETYPLVSGQGSLGLGENVDVSLGGSRDYVGTAGAILDGLGVSSTLERLRYRPVERVELFGQHAFSHYDDSNDRNTALLQALYSIWNQEPLVKIGYQFVFDDTKRKNPLFYTPQRFIANEGVVSVEARPTKKLHAHASLSAGVGSERGGNPEAEASVSAGLEYALTDRFGLFGNGIRSQAARFNSLEGNGGFFLRF